MVPPEYQKGVRVKLAQITTRWPLISYCWTSHTSPSPRIVSKFGEYQSFLEKEVFLENDFKWPLTSKSWTPLMSSSSLPHDHLHQVSLKPIEESILQIVERYVYKANNLYMFPGIVCVKHCYWIQKSMVNFLHFPTHHKHTTLFLSSSDKVNTYLVLQ